MACGRGTAGPGPVAGVYRRCLGQLANAGAARRNRTLCPLCPGPAADQPASLLQPAPAGPVYGCGGICILLLLERPAATLLHRVASARVARRCGLRHPGKLRGRVAWGRPTRPGKSPCGVPGTSHTQPTWSRCRWRGWTGPFLPELSPGYRLPSGFGEVDVAYRFLSARDRLDGRPDREPRHSRRMKSHLNMNVGDMDYASRETSLGPNLGHEMADRPADRGCVFRFAGRRAVDSAAPPAESSSGAFPTTSGASVRTPLWN